MGAGRSPRALGSLPMVLNAVWDAVHHAVDGRTLYGRPCSDLRSFFDACDQDRAGAIGCAKLADALVRLNLGIGPSEAEAWVRTISVQVAGTIEFSELEGWLQLRGQLSPSSENVERKAALASFEDDLYERVPERLEQASLGVRLPQQVGSARQRRTVSPDRDPSSCLS
jgi:hypothetical protein